MSKRARLILASLLFGTTITSTLGCSAARDASDDDESADAALTVGARPWDAAADAEFAQWIAGIGRARETGRCTTLNACVDDPTINPLRAPGDASLNLFADCADVPMELRGYFATKTNRAFRFVSAIEGTGTDLRYAKDAHPTAWSTAAGSKTMQRFLSKISASVHSGFFRMAPEVENDDTYPIDPSRASLRPGTIYYDPNGHVLVVYRVDEDGTIWTFDGHPDNSLTFGRFTQGAYALGTRAQGGGFRNFRPQRVQDGAIAYAANAELGDFGDTQYGHGAGYVDWLRTKLGGTAATPQTKVGEALDQLCLDLQARVHSVAAAESLASAPLAPLPADVYAADGDWEAYSTPSRDARLRASFRNVHRLVQDALDGAPAGERSALAHDLGGVWRAHRAAAACVVRYESSAGATVSLSLDDVMARIYDLSFDPYHCAEMRWGAYPSAASELASCANADAAHVGRFEDERRNRNVIDRDPAVGGAPGSGPDVAEDIDVVALLRQNSGL